MRAIVEDLEKRRAQLGVSKQQLADALCKDVKTVYKQLSREEGDPNLRAATLCEYARALKGEIIFMSEEELIAHESIQDLRNQIAELETIRVQLRAEVDTLNEQINSLLANNQSLIEVNAQQRAMLQKQENAIERKDDMIRRLMEKYVVGSE